MANPDRFVEIGGERFRVEEEGAWIALDLAHKRVHLGQVWHAGTVTTSLANNGTLILNVASGTAQPHMLYTTAAGGNATLAIIEGGTISGTAAVTAYNRNRDISGAPAAVISGGGTVTGGTAIFKFFLPGGTGGVKAGGADRASTEFVGRESKVYSFALVNISGGAVPASVQVDFYEVSES